jgi:hypothetical protein
MITRDYHIEFLTPCFCGGADPSKAELRPSAIRGQLRWWFRCLGGSREEERVAFGGVHEANPAASSFSIRIAGPASGGQADWASRIPSQGIEPRAYLLGFFCGRTRRLERGGALPPRSKASIRFIFRRPPSARLEQTLRVFFSVGALGFRITRCAGAVVSREHDLDSHAWGLLDTELRGTGFDVVLDKRGFGDDWVELIRHAGSFLKNNLRGREGLGISAGRNGSNANALGSATPRQTSVLHMRPVRIDGALRLALLEAPHARILGGAARNAHGNRGLLPKLAQLAT